MPDFSGSSRSVDSWTTAVNQEDASLAAMRALRDLGANADQTGQGSVTFEAGSPLLYRLLGFLTPAARLPIRGVIRLSVGEGGTLVAPEFLSREGRYAVRVDSLSDPAFAKGFARILTELYEVLPEVSVE